MEFDSEKRMWQSRNMPKIPELEYTRAMLDCQIEPPSKPVAENLQIRVRTLDSLPNALQNDMLINNPYLNISWRLVNI